LLSFYRLLKTNVTAISCSNDLQYLAVGFVTGKVLLFSGDITKERRVQTKVFDHESNFPITGLHFYEEKNSLYIFVTTSSTISYYNVFKDILKDKTVIDEKGCEDNCSVLNDEGELVVSRKEAIYFY